MASSATVLSPPPHKPSAIDNDDEEMEYEEIEEEVEVEEEIEEVEDEDAEDEEEDGFGEDLTPVREENKVNDTNQNLELEKHEEHTQSGPVNQGVSVSNLLMGILTVQKNDGDVQTSESSEKESHVNGKRISGDNAIVSLMPETNHTAIEAVDNERQMSPRSCLPQIRFRDPSSNAEFKGEHKKLRIACQFHAKGWCIKGNSCRFLHIRDGLDAAVKKSEVFEGEASSSARILPQQSGENPKLYSETENHRDDTMESTPLQAGSRSFGHNLHLDSYSYHTSHLVKGSLLDNTRISAFGTTSEEIISKKTDMVHTDPRSTDLPHSHFRKPLPIGSPSWNTCALGNQSLLQSCLERRASVSSSLQRSISPVFGSESGNLSRNHVFRDTVLAKYKTKISSDDWEPSVPFHPSHVITQNLLLKERLYDPIRDSIEQTDIRDGQVRFSYSDQGSSIKNVNVQSNSSQEEEKLLNSDQVGDIVKDNILSSSCDNKLKFDNSRHKTELRVDGSGKHVKTDADFKRDGHMQSESKALKHFHAALVEYVKELVRPTWQKGLLSKDAHKVIVKKAVDKVLSALQPNQIPSTGESIKLYLSASQPKLAKLVEGYINKYGKS